MVIIFKIFLRVVFFALLLLLTSCAYDFEFDDLGELKIGQSHAEVLQQLQKQDVKAVTPVIEEPIIIKASEISNISRLNNSQGICFNDNKGISGQLKFYKNNNLSDISLSPRADFHSFTFEVNQSKKMVLSLLKELLQNNNKIIITDCIFNSHWVRLKTIEEDDTIYLQQYSSWRYHKSDSYSYVTLKFVKEKLAKIKYSWRPFEQ